MGRPQWREALIVMGVDNDNFALGTHVILIFDKLAPGETV